MYIVKHTAKEAPQFLGLVCMPHTVYKAVVLVGLHASLNAVEREGRQGGKDTRCTGCHLRPISFDEPSMLEHSVPPDVVSLFSVRHHVARSCSCCCWPSCAVLTLAAGLELGPAGATALCRHSRRLELGTILLLERDQLSRHAFWQFKGPNGSRVFDNGLLWRDQSRRCGRVTAKCQQEEFHEGTPQCVGRGQMRNRQSSVMSGRQ